MNPASWFIVVGVVAVGLAGVLVRHPVARALIWVLALPPTGIGFLALLQGGLAEPFSPGQLATFCAVAFWPAIGCSIGEVRIRWHGCRRTG